MLRAELENNKKEQISHDDIKKKLGSAFTEVEIKKYLSDLENNGDLTVSNIGGHQYFEFTG
jgi:hypothetical protein